MLTPCQSFSHQQAGHLNSIRGGTITQELMSLFHASQLFIQMLPVLSLYDLQNLHRHIRLIKDSSRERQHPEITRIRVTDGQIDIGYIHQPMSVFRVQFCIIPAVEHLTRKACYLPSSTLCRVKKLADESSGIVLHLRAYQKGMSLRLIPIRQRINQYGLIQPVPYCTQGHPKRRPFFCPYV